MPPIAKKRGADFLMKVAREGSDTKFFTWSSIVVQIATQLRKACSLTCSLALRRGLDVLKRHLLS